MGEWTCGWGMNKRLKIKQMDKLSRYKGMPRGCGLHGPAEWVVNVASIRPHAFVDVSLISVVRFVSSRVLAFIKLQELAVIITRMRDLIPTFCEYIE